MTDSYLDQLNPQQRDAVLYADGPQLVIAGAGSGKTRVLTYKIVHLLSLGFEPHRIMALTFTNKAAREMRERIQGIVGQSTANKLWMGTFHSVFLRLLRTHSDRLGFKSNFSIYDSSDSKSLIKTIIRDMNLDDKIYKPGTIAAVISSAKNALISPDIYAAERDIIESDRRAGRPQTYAIYTAYANRCFAASAMDFDDLLYFTNVLLRDNPDLQNHYQNYFQYVLIDEYQDTNFAQHLIASTLCEKSQNFCAVGDDAQSIYSFRGANISNILNLRKTYSSIRTFKLEQNYRSTQNIINAANTLISKNTEQIKKHIFSTNDVGSPITVTQSYSDYEEAVLVATQITKLRQLQHDNYDNYAVLYRTNAQSRRIEEQLRNRNIPYRVYGGMTFLSHKEVKDTLAYIRLAINPDDDTSLTRIINYPKRSIGETTVKRLTRAAIDSNCSIWNILTHIDEYNVDLASGAKRKVLEFRNLVQGMINIAATSDNATTAVSEIIASSKILNEFQTETTPENVTRRQNVQELLSWANEFVETRREEDDNNTSLGDFISQISLATDQDNATENTPCVTLMTAHASKGLEFDNIFITGVEEDLFPSALSRDTKQQIEEERRLLYVAITRAKSNCFMSYSLSRFRNGQTVASTPSRFLQDIDPRYLKLSRSSALVQSSKHNPITNYSQSASAFRKTGINNPLINNRSSGTSLPAGTPLAGGESHSAYELSVGTRIRHNRFGLGTITAIGKNVDNESITVTFDVLGEKKLLLRYAKFDII